MQLNFNSHDILFLVVPRELKKIFLWLQNFVIRFHVTLNFSHLFSLFFACSFSLSCWCRENVLNSQYKGIHNTKAYHWVCLFLFLFFIIKKCCKSLCNYGQFTALQMYTEISQMNFNWLMVNHEKKSYTLFWAMLFIYLFHLESAWKKITKMARCGTKEPE